MLEDTSLAYEPHRITILADDNPDPAFPALTPDGKIPASYDTDGPSGHAQLLDRLGPERFQRDRAGDRAPRGRRGLPVLPRRRPSRRHDRASRAAWRTLSLAGAFQQISALDRRRLRRRAAHGHDPVSEGQRRASACRAVARLRTWGDVLFRDELPELERSLPDFALALALTRESATRRTDFSRRIDAGMVADLAARLPVSPGCAFVCGSSAFVDIAADAALALGLEATAIKTERYGA